MLRPQRKDLATRLSISLPESLAISLDHMVKARGFESRSQAVVEMIHDHLTRHQQELGLSVMAGTINLIYDRLSQDCSTVIAGLQHKYLRECIASLHVQLEQDLTMEVILVQGQGRTLGKITNDLLAVKGVLTGNLNVSTHILPPLEA
jgi:CopG family nickel-responsive transcriptional regulator